ncbi:MAG TPA: glycerol-3-phosphate dehydrogenase [Gemmatimonadaceae bacterium]
MIPDTTLPTLPALAGAPFDLLVIGGGITGAGVARDAALRGLRVALLEKDDFASGTSSRSSRLVHGGVRYLEQAQVHLVFEASAERRRLLRLAPHVVRPLPFTWPVYSGARIGRWTLEAGLTLYDALALFRNVGRHRRLDARALLAEEPALEPAGLRGGARYWDAATDDTRLTLANALGAAESGAAVRNHTMVTALREAQGSWIAGVHDTITGDVGEVRARVVVNATGPWTDEVRRMTGLPDGALVRGSTGAHIAVPRERVGNRGAITLLSPRDGRVMFALPAGTHCIIGTTERATDESPDAVRASEREVQYLIDSANAFFPGARLTRDDVVSAWAGIRPLALAAGGGALGEASREHAIERRGAMLSITGGKLTTYRVMAREAVDAVESQLGRRRTRPEPTRALPLPGGAFASRDAEIAAATALCGDASVGTRLVEGYGDRWRALWERAGEVAGGRERVLPALPYLRAEMAWGIEREMARTLADLLVRRTHVAFETRDAGRAVAREVARWLGWDPVRVAAEVARYDEEVGRIFAPSS